MEASSSWAGVFKSLWTLARPPLLVRTSCARFNVVAADVYFLGASRKRRYQLRYLEKSGDTEQAIASKIGVNHHTLHRWLSDNRTPKRGGGKLAMTALFLRRAGYL
jgi:hypothetical protein